MTDQPPRSRDERRHSPIFVPAVPQLPYGLHRRPWWKRHSRGTFIGIVLLALAIGASFIYAFRVEAAHELDAVHKTP